MLDIIRILKIKERFLTISGKKGKLAVYLAVAIILFLLPLFVKSKFYLHVFNLTFIFIIMSSSLRLILTSGQFSMGHAGFMSIGAYTSALLALYAGVSPWLSIIIGTLACFIVGYLIGIPFTRVRGIYFAMITLFFSAVALAINQIFAKWTGGYSGITSIPPLFHTGSRIPYYYLFLVLTIICLLVLFRLEFSRIGQTWKAVAQSHNIASSIGINEARQRTLAFAIGSTFAGFAGTLYAHYLTLLSQNAFATSVSFNVIVYVLVGGVDSFYGPIIGAAVMVIIPQIFRELKDYLPYLLAGIILIVLFLMPKGIVGVPEQIRNRIKNRREKRDTFKEEVNEP